MGGSGPPTSVQTPPEISANSLKSFCIYRGRVFHACILELLLLTSKEIWFGPPTFFGLATPLVSSLDSSFVCSLNPIRQTSVPRPYAVITVLSFHHCSSQPSQYLSIPSRAYTRLLNESIREKKTFTRLRPQPIENLDFLPSPWLICEFRIKRKKID